MIEITDKQENRRKIIAYELIAEFIDSCNETCEKCMKEIDNIKHLSNKNKHLRNEIKAIKKNGCIK